MARESIGLDFAKYLNENPDLATSLRDSLRRFADQATLAESARASITKQLEDVQLRIFETLKTTYFPTDVFTRVAKQLDAILPANWPRPVPETERIEEVLEIDGIPIVHIPRAEIVQAIVDADDYEARMEIIKVRADDIAEDCMAVLDKRFDDGLEKQIPLARRAIEAYQAGYFEAAQALAVSVCDTYLKKMFHPQPRSKRVGYPTMAKELALANSEDESASWVFNIGYALGPAVPFLVDWRPEDGGEPPTHLSRHVSINNASVDHMTKLNATIAIMLVTGISVALNYPMRLMLQDEP